jgi:FkbM family methyltransferase
MIVYHRRSFKKSYAQCGEDLIVKFIFDALGIQYPSYIDIGAHHPYYLSNTALLYENNCRGINIEPDPVLFKSFISQRKQDINLNVGIGAQCGTQDFYIFNEPTLNTFSKSDADKYKLEGNYSVVTTAMVKVETINDIIRQYSHGTFPDFMSLDAEGVDDIILKSINYQVSCPLVICVETLSFSNTGQGIKNERIIEFLKSNDYLVYADTNINTIFVRKDRWIRKK